MDIKIKSLGKKFGATVVLNDVCLEVREREFIGLLGPSGSGKTTLLRILAGLEFEDSGEVLFGDTNVREVPVELRRVGMVFQHYALFDHMTIFDNVAFGLQVRPRRERLLKPQIKERVERLLELVQLKDYGRRIPSQLSGGQRQRIALARALATEPKVLLLDEPFGALDAKVRIELRRWLRDLHDTTGLTTIFVTHDQEEALALADRIAIMAHGRIEQVGSPTEVYEEPRSPFVYDFLGRINAFDCEVANARVRLGDKDFDVPDIPDGAAVAFVRPHDVLLCAPEDAMCGPDTVLHGLAEVRVLTVLGPAAWVEMAYENRVISAQVSREVAHELGLRSGSKCSVQLRLPCFFSKSEADSSIRNAASA